MAQHSFAVEPFTASIEVFVDESLQAVYDACASMEDFPRFIPDLEEVVPLEPNGLRYRCRGRRAGRPCHWEIEVTERVPNEAIAWRKIGEGGLGSAVVARFEELASERTRLIFEYSIAS